MHMTKAMYSIGKTFKEMVSLHNNEIQNHQDLIDKFISAAAKSSVPEEQTIFTLEAIRNKEHQEGHIKMRDLYQSLIDNVD